MHPSASARWLLIAMLTFQLSIGLQWPVAYAAVATPEGQSDGMVTEHCPGHAADTPKSASQSRADAGSASHDPAHNPHDCCGSLGCYCHGVPTLLAPELSCASTTRFVLPMRPAAVASQPVARPTELFRPPIA
jgi:hypothetical protein